MPHLQGQAMNNCCVLIYLTNQHQLVLKITDEMVFFRIQAKIKGYCEFRHFTGLSPTTFLNVLEKVDTEVKPTLEAICSIEVSRS